MRKCYWQPVAHPQKPCELKKVLQDIFDGMTGTSKEPHYDIAKKYFKQVKIAWDLPFFVQHFLFVDQNQRDVPESNLYRDVRSQFPNEDRAFTLTAIVLLALCP